MRNAMLLLAVFGLAGMLWAADPFEGTWKLNAAKSKLAGPPPKSEIVKITPQASGFKWATETVDKEGKIANAMWLGKYDGKAHLYTGNSDIDSIASKKTDANTLDVTFMKAGKAVGTGQAIVSKEGKMLTLISKIKNAQGEEATNTAVYDKQ